MKNIFSQSILCLLLLQTSNYVSCMRDIEIQTDPVIPGAVERYFFTKDLHKVVKKLKYKRDFQFL